jgi:hypothetical protein
MKTITVQKKLLINLGNFSNLTIEAQIETDEGKWEDLWNEVNSQIAEQEVIERSLRIKQSKPAVKTKENLPF